MTLHYVISVHAKFLLGFFCLWVCRPEECFWLNLHCHKGEELVLGHCSACCLLLILGIIWQQSDAQEFVSLLLSDCLQLGRVSQAFPIRHWAFCSFHILQTKMHLTLLPVFSFGNRCVSSHPSSHTVTSWECLFSILTFSWIIVPSESRASYVHSYTD